MKEVLLETLEWILKNVWTCPFKVMGYDFFFYYVFRWLLGWPESNQTLFLVIGLAQSALLMALLAYLCVKQTKRLKGQTVRLIPARLLYGVCILFYVARLYVLTTLMMA